MKAVKNPCCAHVERFAKFWLLRGAAPPAAAVDVHDGRHVIATLGIREVHEQRRPLNAAIDDVGLDDDAWG
jgi:hypothetical protein